MEEKYKMIMDLESIDEKYTDLINTIKEKTELAVNATDKPEDRSKLLNYTLQVIRQRLLRELKGLQETPTE